MTKVRSVRKNLDMARKKAHKVMIENGHYSMMGKKSAEAKKRNKKKSK